MAQGINDHVVIYPTSIHNASYVKNSHEGERMADDSVIATPVEGAQLPIDLTVVRHVDPAADINRLKAQQGDEAVELKKRDTMRILINKWDGAPPDIGDGGIPFINPALIKPGQNTAKGK